MVKEVRVEKGKVIIIDTAASELEIAETFSEQSSGCPHCGNETVEWAELMGDTYWKQCADCGMIYVGHDALQEEING